MTHTQKNLDVFNPRNLYYRGYNNDNNTVFRSAKLNIVIPEF